MGDGDQAGSEYDSATPWVFRSEYEGKLLGLFDIRQFVAWHDDRVDANVAFDTIVHEEIHATGIAGSFLHLVLVADLYNRRAGGTEPNQQYWDYVALHEAQPKAYDLLTGRKTSLYGDPAILKRAEVAADIVRRVEANFSKQGINADGMPIILLRALFLALSDQFNASVPISALDLLTALLDFHRQPSASIPHDLDLRRPLTPQLRGMFADSMRREFGQAIVVCSNAFLISTSFLILVTTLLTEDPTTAYWSDLFLPLLNLIFTGAVVPHAAVRPDRQLIKIAPTLYIVRKLMESVGAWDASSARQLREVNRALKFENRAEYVYQGFLVNHIGDIDHIGDESMFAYFCQLFGGFPATFVGLCDGVFDPQARRLSSNEWESLCEYFAESSYRDVWQVALDHYRDLRDPVWKGLCNAVPNMPFRLSKSIIDSLQGWKENGNSAVEMDVGHLDIFFGDYHFARVVPPS